MTFLQALKFQAMLCGIFQEEIIFIKLLVNVRKVILSIFFKYYCHNFFHFIFFKQFFTNFLIKYINGDFR